MYLVTSKKIGSFSKFCGFLRISELSLLQAYANFPLSYFMYSLHQNKNKNYIKKVKNAKKFYLCEAISSILKKVEIE